MGRGSAWRVPAFIAIRWTLGMGSAEGVMKRSTASYGGAAKQVLELHRYKGRWGRFNIPCPAWKSRSGVGAWVRY